MGLKRGAIWNTIGEHNGNLKGTCWEQRKNEKNTNEGICMIIYLFELFFGGRFLWWMNSHSHHPSDSPLGVVYVEETHPHCSVYDLEKIFLTSKF
jgi:hypothetical protein